MSEITLLNVIENLKNSYRLSEYQKAKCDEFFSFIKIGDYIYPGNLKSKICISISEAYSFMEELRKHGFVINVYEVYCSSCGKSKGIYLESLVDFKEDSACDFCNEELSPDNDLIVLYKVISL